MANDPEYPDDSEHPPSSTHDSLVEQRTRQLVFEIEERKRAEESLRESDERFRSILNNTTSVVCLKDLRGHYLFVNRRFRELFHVAPDEISTMTDTDLFPRDTADALAANDQQVLDAGEAMEFEEQLPQDDGLHTYISVKFPLKHASGNVYGICGISTDITDRKAAELKLAEKTMELERSNRDLQQFAYVASHDLQEPLRMVTTYLQLLVRKDTGLLSTEAMEFIGFAVDGAKRMSSLIRDLMEFSRVETQGREFKRSDLAMLIEQALRNLETCVEENQAQIIISDGMPTLNVDATQLTSAFQNLVGNAIKYRAPERNPVIRIEAVQDDREWVFSVSDNGIGIEPQYHDRIFKVFQRLHTREEFEGTGIGLAVVKRIVERHGGRIWLDSKAGEGSTFHFTLPGRLDS